MGDVSLERALEFVRSHPASVHYAVTELAGNFKVRSSVNNHCVYLHKSRGADLTGPLRKVDTTLPVLGQPGTRQSPPNGSIAALLDPTLEALDRFLPMMGDASLAGTRKKAPRPFQVRAVPPPAARPRSQTVRPTVEPVPVGMLSSGEHAPIRPGAPLAERLVAIWDGARRAKRRSVSDIADRLAELDRGEGDPAGETERDDLAARRTRLMKEVADLTDRIDRAREPEVSEEAPSEEEEREAELAAGKLREELAEEGVRVDSLEVERPAFVDIMPEEEL